MSKYKVKPAAPRGLKTYPLRSRPSKIGVEQFGRAFSPDRAFVRFVDSLPDILASKDFKDFLQAMMISRQKERPIIFGLGAHVLKVGLTPVLIDLMKTGWITALALNGAGIIHDFEIAYAGRTSEDVSHEIKNGDFGMAEETGHFLNEAILSGFKQNLGLGEAVGKMLAESDFPYKEASLLSAAYDMSIPVTVHVAVGTDIIHFHPGVDGRALGETSLKDFFLLCSLVENLDGGVFCAAGSAVILPEVFLKCISFARNKGASLQSITTAVFDFKKHYRPEQNIVKRPPGDKGKGYYFIGHHELMIPLLAASLKSLSA